MSLVVCALGREAQAAHSTLEVNSQNSSDVWSSFRVARRAYVVDVAIDQRDTEILISSTHNGYCRLNRGGLHKREWRLRDSGLSINDVVLGSILPSISRVYFHPDVDVTPNVISFIGL